MPVDFTVADTAGNHFWLEVKLGDNVLAVLRHHDGIGLQCTPPSAFATCVGTAKGAQRVEISKAVHVRSVCAAWA